MTFAWSSASLQLFLASVILGISTQVNWGLHHHFDTFETRFIGATVLFFVSLTLLMRALPKASRPFLCRAIAVFAWLATLQLFSRTSYAMVFIGITLVLVRLATLEKGRLKIPVPLALVTQALHRLLHGLSGFIKSPWVFRYHYDTPHILTATLTGPKHCSPQQALDIQTEMLMQLPRVPQADTLVFDLKQCAADNPHLGTWVAQMRLYCQVTGIQHFDVDASAAFTKELEST